MDNRRLLLAALLSAAVILVWNWIFPPVVVTPEEAAPTSQAVQAQGSAGSAAGVVAQDAADPGSEVREGSASLGARLEFEPVQAQREEVVVLENNGFHAEVSNRGGVIHSLVSPGPRGVGTVEMVVQDGGHPLLLWADRNGQHLSVNEALFQVETRSGTSVSLRYADDSSQATKTLELTDGGDLLVSASGTGGEFQNGFGLLLGPGARDAPYAFLEDTFQHRGGSYSNGKVEKLTARKVDEPTVVPGAGLRFAAIEDTYFVQAFFPSEGLGAVSFLPYWYAEPTEGGEPVASLLPLDAEKAQRKAPRRLALLASAQGGSLSGRILAGPKNYDRLAAEGVGLERTVRWGFFRIIARPLQIGLNWIYDNVIANYGWAIVLMTFLIRLCMLPITHKSYASMEKMRKLNPAMEGIRKKYRPKLRDKQGRPNFEMQKKMNEEMQELFRSEGVNPAAGCLPMVIQLPVFLSFYYLLRGAVELWQAPWALWIHDLAAPDSKVHSAARHGGDAAAEQQVPAADAKRGAASDHELDADLVHVHRVSVPGGSGALLDHQQHSYGGATGRVQAA